MLGDIFSVVTDSMENRKAPFVSQIHFAMCTVGVHITARMVDVARIPFLREHDNVPQALVHSIAFNIYIQLAWGPTLGDAFQESSLIIRSLK